MAGWLLDLRYAWRLLRRTPWPSAGAVAVLTLGIGVTTAIHGVVHAALLKPLPYIEPDRLVIVAGPSAPHPLDARRPPFSYLILGTEARAMAARVDIFESVAPFELWTTGFTTPLEFTDGRTAEPLRGGLVEPDFFSVLGVQAALGRTFRRGDRSDEVVVISDALWRRRFAGAPGVLSRTIRVDGAPRAIVGVLPAHVDVTYPVGTEVWGLLAEGQVDTTGRTMTFHTIARLQPGVSVETATAALGPIIARSFPSIRSTEQKVIAQPVAEWAAGVVGPALLLVSGAAGLLLLAACATAGLLLLGRAMRRSPDTAVRAALGASRGRLLRQALVESTVVGMVAAAGGVLVAMVLHPVVRWVAPPTVPRLDELTVNSMDSVECRGRRTRVRCPDRLGRPCRLRGGGGAGRAGAGRRGCHEREGVELESRAAHRADRCGGGAARRGRPTVAQLLEAAACRLGVRTNASGRVRNRRQELAGGAGDMGGARDPFPGDAASTAAGDPGRPRGGSDRHASIHRLRRRDAGATGGTSPLWSEGLQPFPDSDAGILPDAGPAAGRGALPLRSRHKSRTAGSSGFSIARSRLVRRGVTGGADTVLGRSV